MARPEPMNATPFHAKARVTLSFSDPLFVAGQHVTGKMELECRADKGFGLGIIKAELFAIQELTSRDHSATSTFLHLTRVFQGPTLPPSNAVLPFPIPGSDPLPPDYFPARKGVTTFFFRFPLPESTPTSIEFGKGLARLKYEVRASVDVAWKGERQTVMERREVDVVEAAGEPSRGSEQVVVGEGGKMWVQGHVSNPFIIAGSSACVELFVKNHSTKKTTGLNLSLSRHLRLPSILNNGNSLQISDNLLNVPFRGADYIVHPGTEGVANLVFDIPKAARGVRGGKLDTGEDDQEHHEMESLFSVQCLLTVKLGMGFGSKDIILELPVNVVHPHAMALRAPLEQHFSSPPRTYVPPERFASPTPYSNRITSPTPYTQRMASPPPITYQPQYQPQYMSPPVSPPPQMHQWYPQQPLYPYTHNEQYYYPPPPVPQTMYPVRPSSADPYVAQQLPPLPQQQQVSSDLLASPAHATSLEPMTAEGEMGKGDRASRISAHLRQSSRTRSVSPQSHRFPAAIPMTVVESTDESTVVISQTTPASRPLPIPKANPSSPRLSQKGEPFLGTTLTSSVEVLSPRPVLSPKHSFSIDCGTVKSERVERLERMAAESEVEVNDGQGRVDKKTTGDELIMIDPDEPEPQGTPKMPPEPTLAPIAFKPKPDLFVWPSESGLDALERKLLAQVGTRKPEPERRADVRTVLPITIPAANDLRTDPPIDSAISSLALGADNLREDSKWPSSPPRDILDRPLPLPPSIKPELLSVGNPATKVKEEEKRSDVRKLRRAATGRVEAWLGGIEHATPPPPCETPPTPATSSPLVSTEDDIEPVDHDPHPLLRSPANGLPDFSNLQEQEVEQPAIPTRSSGFVLHPAHDSSSFNVPKSEGWKVGEELAGTPHTTTPLPSSEPSRPESLAIGPLPSPPKGYTAVNEKPVLKRFSLRPPFDQLNAQYDIRSARGGRGGKVTSVAALWSSISDQKGGATQDVQKGNTTAQVQPRPAARLSSEKTLFKVESPERTKTPLAKSNQANRTPPSMNLADLTARRAKMVKSPSVPALVSSSLATPMISSTASLARPLSSPKRTLPVPSVSTTPRTESPIQERSAQGATASNGEMNFGQARLKDLIRKYQQGL